MNDVVAFADRDPTTAGTYAVQVVRVSSTRTSTMCAGQLVDDASLGVSELALASGSDGQWLALTERDQVRIKRCDLLGAELVGTPAIANAGALAFVGFAGATSTPTVAYVDRGPSTGSPRVPADFHFRIKQPNR